jgi:glutathione S-transferase
MLDHKGVEHELVDFTPGLQPLMLRAHGFRAATVPALSIDGRRVQGTLKISRALEGIVPEPPLFPSDPDRLRRVEEAERWGEETYQPLPRRMFRWALTKDGSLRSHLAAESGLPLPGLAGSLSLPTAIYFARIVGADDARIRADLNGLPGTLDHVDALIAEGVLGGAQANAADFQIAPTTGVLLNIPQLRPLIEGRPAGEHADRFGGRFGAEIPIRLPEQWLPRTETTVS